MQASVYNVDESTANGVCDSVANALDGTVSDCSLSDGDIMYMKIIVADVSTAILLVAAEDFESTLENVPSSVAVIEVLLDDSTTEEPSEETTEEVTDETTEEVTDETTEEGTDETIEEVTEEPTGNANFQ